MFALIRDGEGGPKIQPGCGLSTPIQRTAQPVASRLKAPHDSTVQPTMNPSRVFSVCCTAGLCLGAFTSAPAQTAVPPPAPLRPTLHLADYDAELRRPDGRVDSDGMVQRLQVWASRLTTGCLARFHRLGRLEIVSAQSGASRHRRLALSGAAIGKRATLRATHAEPFRLDYARWGEEIARLSVGSPNLTAWVIDDFYANPRLLHAGHLRRLVRRRQAINPRLAFLPLMYFPDGDANS